MKILLVSSFFAPNNTIGALRPTKIATFLAAQGHTVDVVTAGGSQDKSYNIPSNIRSIYIMDPYVDEPVSNNKLTSNVIYKLAHASNGRLMNNFRNYRYEFQESRLEKRFVNYFLSLVNNELFGIEYDAIITSYSPLSSLICGLEYKKMYPRVNWICDFRDPVLSKLTPLLFRCKRKMLQRKACSAANTITAVSVGALKQICGKKYTEKQLLLPNGYDSNDLIEVLSETEEHNQYSSEQLKFAYVGSLYRRNLSIFFKAISELRKSREIDTKNIQLLYAGTDFTALYTQAKQYNCEEILQNKGKLCRRDCLLLQRNANYLLLATWNTKKEQGIFTGKFLEYMMMRKPIIATIMGDVPNSDVAQVIRNGCLGIAYEEACDKTEYLLLKKYISMIYNEYTKKGEIFYTPNEEVIDCYRWENLIKELESKL